MVLATKTNKDVGPYDDIGQYLTTHTGTCVGRHRDDTHRDMCRTTQGRHTQGRHTQGRHTETYIGALRDKDIKRVLAVNNNKVATCCRKWHQLTSGDGSHWKLCAKSCQKPALRGCIHSSD